jgi:hypothetical protein
MRTRPARLRTVAPSILLMLAVAACGGGEEVVHQAPQASKWLSSALAALRGADEAPRLRGVSVGRFTGGVTRSRTGSSIDDLLKQAPRTPTAEEAAALARLRAIAAFDNAIKAAVTSVDQSWNDVELSVRLLSARSAPTANTRAVNWLTEKGKTIVRDASCELSWGQMTEDENTEVDDLVDTQGWQPANTQQADGISSMTQSAAIGAIRGNAKTSFYKIFFSPRVVDWYLYAKGLYDKAVKLSPGGSKHIRHPDGTVTVAFVYYLRTCLRPPK